MVFSPKTFFDYFQNKKLSLMHGEFHLALEGKLKPIKGAVGGSSTIFENPKYPNYVIKIVDAQNILEKEIITNQELANSKDRLNNNFSIVEKYLGDYLCIGQYYLKKINNKNTLICVQEKIPNNFKLLQLPDLNLKMNDNSRSYLDNFLKAMESMHLETGIQIDLLTFLNLAVSCDSNKYLNSILIYDVSPLLCDINNEEILANKYFVRSRINGEYAGYLGLLDKISITANQQNIKALRLLLLKTEINN